MQPTTCLCIFARCRNQTPVHMLSWSHVIFPQHLSSLTADTRRAVSHPQESASVDEGRLGSSDWCSWLILERTSNNTDSLTTWKHKQSYRPADPHWQHTWFHAFPTRLIKSVVKTQSPAAHSIHYTTYTSRADSRPAAVQHDAAVCRLQRRGILSATESLLMRWTTLKDTRRVGEPLVQRSPHSAEKKNQHKQICWLG